MATRSTFVVQMEDGTFHRNYCHSDGYLEHNGMMLHTHYNSAERARALAAMGDCSFLDRRLAPDPGERHGFEYGGRAVECSVFYGRDRSDSESTGDRYATLAEALQHREEYAYVWKDGQWWVDCDGDEDDGDGRQLPPDQLAPLAQALVTAKLLAARAGAA
jgi:hypothetical protein